MEVPVEDMKSGKFRNKIKFICETSKNLRMTNLISFSPLEVAIAKKSTPVASNKFCLIHLYIKKKYYPLKVQNLYFK